MSYATIARLAFKLGIWADKKAGNAPLFMHHARICAKCHKPIKRVDHYRIGEGGRAAHKDCNYPSGNYPLPEALATFVSDDGPDAA